MVALKATKYMLLPLSLLNLGFPEISFLMQYPRQNNKIYPILFYIFYQQLFIKKLRLEEYVVHITLVVKPDFNRIICYHWWKTSSSLKDCNKCGDY